ncbi:potassium transporter KefB [Mucilaginibacter terrenus]|uniref:Potassium transporter KefB n=1 Tax=Mucilaginibacter terrenus TaxID=2482727 RepID=A0A3E2NTK2_9SPHI|nr:potassium transporter KefB [Mucilaginibacter terrenus]RFZ84251.1 potassium transporter KefB [Mucilaginibacter terrenus]
MTQGNILTSPIRPSALVIRMLIGAGIGLVLIGLFLSGVNHPNPAWPKYWMARPLIIVPLAGATGGAISYFLDGLRQQGGWKMFAAITLSLVIYLIGLFMGTVLGLDGTLWN